MKKTTKAMFFVTMYAIIFALSYFLYEVQDPWRHFVVAFLMSLVLSWLYSIFGPFFAAIISAVIGDPLLKVFRSICRSEESAKDAQFYTILLSGLVVAAGVFLSISILGTDHGPSILEKYRL